MVNKNIFFVVLLCSILIMPLALAGTTINVKTISGHKASVIMLGAGDTYEFLDSKHVPTGDTGEVSIDYAGDRTELDVLVKITKDGEDVVSHRFDGMDATSPMYLQVIPGKISENYKELEEKKAAEEAAKAVPEVVEESVDGEIVQEGVAEENSEGDENSKVTGNAISIDSIKIPKNVYYIVGGIILAAAILLAGLKMGPSVVRAIPRPSVGGYSGGATTKQLADAERRIKEAQAEINKLKNRDKIDAAERKMQKDKEELERLKKGIEDDKEKLDKWEDGN